MDYYLKEGGLPRGHFNYRATQGPDISLQQQQQNTTNKNNNDINDDNINNIKNDYDGTSAINNGSLDVHAHMGPGVVCMCERPSREVRILSVQLLSLPEP